MLLFIPKQYNTARLLAIDPGSKTMGVSLLEFDFDTRENWVLDSFTIDADRRVGTISYVSDYHGDRATKLLTHHRALKRLLEEWEPDAVVSESPYMGRFPQAFEALTDTMNVIRSAVREYNMFLHLHKFDPATVKTAVGVSGKSGDKEAIRRALQGLPDLRFTESVLLSELDEHSVDSIAVGYAFTKHRF